MRIVTVVAIATGVAALAPASVDSAQGLDRYKVIAECTDTINRYAHTRDQLDAEGHASLFAEDGEFEFGGATTTGREAIAQRIRYADRSAMTRHMSTRPPGLRHHGRFPSGATSWSSTTTRCAWSAPVASLPSARLR
jgi:hypothetical protein